MNRPVSLCVLWLIPAMAGSQSSWVRQSPPPALTAVHFADLSNGIAVGRGVVLQTSDGGYTWFNRPVPKTLDLQGVFFADLYNAFAVGPGTILWSTDKGVSWSSQESGTANVLTGLHFVDARTGMVVGDGTVLRTTNSGLIWENLSKGTPNTVNAISFIDENVGWAVGGRGTILRTTNGGMTWEIQPSTTSADLAALSFTGALNGTVVGYEYEYSRSDSPTDVILRTTDGGNSWVDRSAHTSTELRGVHFTSAQSGMVVGENTILRTDDGGMTWTDQMDGTTRDIFAIAVIDTMISVAVGDRGTMLRTTNTGITWARQNSGTTRALRGVVFNTASVGIAVGDGVILRSTDGGLSWILRQEMPGLGLRSPTFTDASTVVVTGVDGSTSTPSVGVVMRSTDEGESWTQIWSGTSVSPSSIAFSDANHGTLVGSRQDSVGNFSGLILQTTDGGANWSTRLESPGWELRDVAFRDANCGIAVGAYWSVGASALIVRTVDGGATWQGIDFGTRGVLSAVSFLDTSTAVAAADGSIRQYFLRTTDAGASWGLKFSPTKDVMNDIGSVGFGKGYAVGSGGRILYSDNEGVQWTERSGLIRMGAFRDVSYVHGGSGTIVGGSQDAAGNPVATMLRTTNGGLSWVPQQTGMTDEFFKIAFADSNNGVMVGAGGYSSQYGYTTGVIFRTTNGGASWAREFTKDNVQMQDVSVFDRNRAVAVGLYSDPNGNSVSTLFWTTDGGTHWASAGTDGIGNMFAVAFAGATAQLLAGHRGTILRTSDAGATWKDVSGAGHVVLTDVFFTDPLSGVAIGYEGDYWDNYYDPQPGTVLRTTDGGETWTRVWPFPAAMLRGVWFGDAHTGCAVGLTRDSTGYPQGTLFRTSDGGINWVSQTLVPRGELNNIVFTDASHGVAVGQATTEPGFSMSVLLRTSDAGISWSTGMIGMQGNLVGISFPNLATGTAVGASWWWGSGGAIVRTTDAGTTWTSYMGTTSTLKDVSFIDEETGLAVGEWGAIVRTTNAGGRWNTEHSGTFAHLNALALTDNPRTAIVVGDSGTILRSTDGGSAWVRQASGTSYSLRGVFFIDATSGVAVGDSGTILGTTDGGMTWSPQSSGTKGALLSAFYADKQTGIVIGWENIHWGWGWGGNAIMLRTTNGGSSWTHHVIDSVRSATAAHFSSRDVGFVATSGGTILRTSDSGTTWTVVEGGKGWTELYDIFSDDGLNVTAVGLSVAIHCQATLIIRSTDGGLSWNEQTNRCWGSDPLLLSGLEALCGVHFVDPQMGFAVGDGGTIYRTTNGGVTWTEKGPSHEAPPQQYGLAQNYPNPFNSQTTISYQVPAPAHVRLAVYDILGRAIEVLVDEEKPAGTYIVPWNTPARASGIYFVRLRAGNVTDTKKMLLVR